MTNLVELAQHKVTQIALLISVVLALVGFGAGMAKTNSEIRAVRDVPQMIVRHDSVTSELVRIARVQLCLNLSDRRHTDWTACLDAH